MIVSIHQPHYFPWLRYINKIAVSDIFVIYDDVKYQKNGWIHRAMIRNQDEAVRITIPVHYDNSSMINDVYTVNDTWKVKHLKNIQYAYQKSPFFSDHIGQISQIIFRNHKYLLDINIDCIKWVIGALGLKTKVLKSSEMKIHSRSTERIIHICQELGADTYLSGYHALCTYLQPVEFKSAGIRIVYPDFICEPYQQLKYKDFISDLSIIDLLMNNSAEECASFVSRCKLIEV